MEKVKVSLPEISWKKVPFNDDSIVLIKTFLDASTKMILMADYIDSLKEEGKSETARQIQAEYGLILGVLDLCTDIDISEFTSVEIDKIVSSGLWGLITSNIANYWEFDTSLTTVVEREMKKNSFEESMKKLVEKLDGTLDKISSVDFSEEGVAKLIQSLKSETEKLDKIIPVVQAEPEPAKPKRAYKKKESPK